MKLKTTILMLIGVLIFSIGIVVYSFLYNSDKANYQHTSFNRNFLHDAIQLTSQLDIQYNSYYLAGATQENIYFGNVTAPWKMLMTNTMLSDSQHVKLQTEGQDDFTFHSIYVTVDSPYFYLVEGSIPAIFKGNIVDWYGYRHTYGNAPFLESKPINETSFVMRTISSRSKEFTLGKQMNFHPYVKLAPGLLEKQIDGSFCTDGMLHFNKELGMLVYVYYYRNQFICADTSLNLLYRGNTIDTISQAKITVAKIKSDSTITLSSPPLTVNNKSCVSGNWLFINSNILAKNEGVKDFEHSSVIDVYNLKDGQYQFSFYLPEHKGKKVREFKVYDYMLIAMYDHYVLKYQLDPHYFTGGSDTTAEVNVIK